MAGVISGNIAGIGLAVLVPWATGVWDFKLKLQGLPEVLPAGRGVIGFVIEADLGGCRPHRRGRAWRPETC